MTSPNVAQSLPASCPARLIGVFESGSPEWHEARAAGIGGSEVGVICGLNKWESPLSLWAKKLKLIDDERIESEAMYWGTTLEPVVIAEFIKRHPELEVFPSPGTFSHAERPWQIANPDGLARHRESGEWFVIEIKTARYEDEWNEDTGDIPPSYRAQVLWYLDAFQFQRAYVATLFSGSKYREFELATDEFEAAANLERVKLWRDYLENQKQPDYDGAESTYNAIRAIHPAIDPELPDVELGATGSDYIAAQANFEDAQAKFNESKSRVLDAMGKAKRGLVAGAWTVTRQARGTGLPYLVNKKG
jgi:putative phage-type endonuclease